MSAAAFSRGFMALVSDPENLASGTSFTFSRAPLVAILPDTHALAIVRLGDGSFRQDRIGDPLRNLDMAAGPGAFLGPADVERWRLFRLPGHFVSVYPNYDLCTSVLLHCEGNITSEVIGSGGGHPVFVGSGGSYVSGILGGALDLGATQALRFDATAAATMSLNMWLQFPADASWGSLNGLYRAGVNHWLAWSHTSDLMRFRISGGNELDVTAGQLPTLVAGEWFNFGISYTTGTSARAGRIVINGDAAYTFDKTISADPTFDASWYIGVAPITGNVTFGGVLDEVRVNPSFWDTTSHGACYDRMTEVTAKIIAGQMQGHYMQIIGDSLAFVSGAQTDRMVGSIRLSSGYVNNLFVVDRVSSEWPT